jgi:cation diffusion facilitator CzcD-associated flavoprotein CzcO
MKTPLANRDLTKKRPEVSLSPECDIAIVGAGPYGLSAGAYFTAKGLGLRVFGRPMEFWTNKMSAGCFYGHPERRRISAIHKIDLRLRAARSSDGSGAMPSLRFLAAAHSVQISLPPKRI